MPRHFSPVCEICANNLKIPTTYYLLYYSASSQFECRLVLERGNLLLSLDWTIRCHHVGCIPQLSPHSRVTLEVAEMSRPVTPTLHSKSFDEKQENPDAFSISLFHSNPLLFRNTTKYHFHCSWFKKILNCSGDWRQNYDVKGTVLQLW